MSRAPTFVLAVVAVGQRHAAVIGLFVLERLQKARFGHAPTQLVAVLVAEQASLVELLREQVRRLSGQMGELAEVVNDKAPDDPPPPHY